jgi:hypothetical protein
MTLNITFDQLFDTMRSLGHAVFVRGDFNLNLIGLRVFPETQNKFDDVLCCAYRDGGAWRLQQWPCTTDPGTFWLKNPMNVDGTACLVPGQYRRTYEIGTHKGYKALVQRAPVTVWRDANRDGVIDRTGPTQTGMFGINIHRANAETPSENVNKWSAGCQVLADARHLTMLLDVVAKASIRYGPKITYTLIDWPAKT